MRRPAAAPTPPATIDTLGELREESLSPEVRDELLEAFRGWKQSA